MKTNNLGNPVYTINIMQCKDDSINQNDNTDKKENKCEIKEQKTKDKKVDFQLDLQNKSELNIKTKKSLKKSILKTKKSFNKKHHFLNLETNFKNEKLNQSNEYPKSSLNIKNQLANKSFQNEKNSFYNKSVLAVNNNKSFHNKGKLNQTKINFLKLINPNNINKVYNNTDSSLKDFVHILELDSLNLIEKNLQNKILDMGKEPDFLEFETRPLELSINNGLNLRKKKPKLTTKRTKKEEDKNDDINSFVRHKTVIHKKIINNLSGTNMSNSNSDDKLFGNNDSKIKIHFSNNKLLNSIYQNDKLNQNKKNIKNNINNNHKNNISNKYYKINLMKSTVNGRRSSINHFLKSTHSFKSTAITRSKTALHAKRNSFIDEENSPKVIINNDDIIPTFIAKKHIFQNFEKFRILTHKKLVYDSLDDEEIIEDTINDNFYLKPDDKIVLIIDSIILFFTFYNMVYMPLKLVLNNCDITNSITSIDFQNITNIFIDFLFICDLILNFFKAYYNFDEQLVIKSDKIIINYLKHYFIIDFISAIPYYSIIKLISLENHKTLIRPIKCSKYYNHEINDIYQIIELLKLIKIIKCISNENILTNYIKTFVNQIDFFESWSFLLSSSFLTLLVLHLTACIHIFISSTTFPNWIVYKNMDTCDFGTIYLSSIYFLITTVTSVGYGDITGNSITEFIFQIFLLIIGIIAYSWLISSISNYVKENNQQSEIFDQKISILKEIKLEHPKMTKELYDKIYLHLEYINLSQKKDKSSLIDSLPHSVKKSLLHEMYKPIIENFNFFKNFNNSEFVNRVISKLKPVLAVKNDLLLEQGEIIEDTIFVKQGRLSLEVKIDTDHPEKSVEKLVNEEYFFGMENNELYQKSAFGGIINMTAANHNQSFINKKNLYNLYSGNTLIEKNNQKVVKSVVTNACGKPEIQKHPNQIINYINLRILDIRKNEHFGALLMFLNKRSPLTLRVKTKKAELFFLKKIDAVEISTSYPNIWKRVNKKSFHNLKQIKRIMKKIIVHFCETYGIDYDFGTKFLNSTTIKELKRLKSKQSIDQNLHKKIHIRKKFNILNNKFKDPRRPSVGILNTQLKKFQQHFPKQTRIITTKTNFEKDIEELIPKNFERDKIIKENENNNNNNENSEENETSEENENSEDNENSEKNEEKEDNNSKSKKELSEEKENPIDCSISIIKLDKKSVINNDNNDISKKNDISINNNEKNEINLKNISQNGTENNNSNKKIVYGEEETNNLMKFFGTPYYPEDINDEVYPGEVFEIKSQVENANNAYEQEYSPVNNFLLSYDASKNNIPIIKNNLSSLNNIDIHNKLNNFTINNNYITNNVINNLNSNKSNNNLSIFRFNLNFKNYKTHKNFPSNDDSKILNYSVSKQSFEISKPQKTEKFAIKSNSISSNKIKSILKNKKTMKRESNTKIKKQKTRNMIFNNAFNIQKLNTNLRRRNSCQNRKIEIIKNESDSFSSSESLSLSSYSSQSNENKNEDLFICSPVARKRNSLRSCKSMARRNMNNNNKNFKIKKNIIIKIKAKYENLNEITDGKISKSKKLQNCIKNILLKKLSKHTKKEESLSPKKIRNPVSIKLVKHKTMAKKMPDKFSKNNLYKITVAADKLKKTEVKSLFKKPQISEIHEKSSIIPANKNNSRYKDISRDSSLNNSMIKKLKYKKKNDEFLLDYVNKNIRDDNAVLNNPGKFYNGLFSNIMKKVTIKQNFQEK